VFLFTTLIASCTVGPNYHRPVELLPSHYSGSNSKFSEHQLNQFWWSSLGDPVLVGLINQALAGSSLDVQESYAKIRRSRAELASSKAGYFPQVDARGKVSRDLLSGNSEILSAFPPGLIPLNYTDYRFGFDASWELDFFGYTRRGVEASRARFQRAIENQYNVAISTAAEVATAYTQYRVYQQRIFIVQKTIASYRQTVKLVKLQIQAGSATVVDLSRIESEVLSAKAALPPLQAESKASLAALSVLIGSPPESLFKKLSQARPIPTMHPKKLSVGLPSDLLQRRPDIIMAERALAAATADIGVATANQFPRFQLLGNIGSDTTIPGTFFETASRYWSIGPQIAIPLLNGGRLKNAVKAQEAARDIALARYRKSVLQALADVETALVRYDRERLRRRELEASYNKLKIALRLVKLQYQEGQTDLMNVLDVERKLNLLGEQQCQSDGQVTIYLVSLYKALGGSWV
jgi:NodT family efflux transporter outer membrane factor (OMF) lipoprotein